jgi:hypothetical protein
VRGINGQPIDGATATPNHNITLPTNNATVTNPNTVSPTPSGEGTAVAQNPNQPTQADTNGQGPATDNPTQNAGDGNVVQNPTPTDPGTQQPRTLQSQVDTNQGVNPFTNAVTNFTNGLAGAQAAGKVITDTVASLSQETRQQIADAFNKFNEGTSLVEPADRLSGSAIGILEGLGILPNVQTADSGSSSGFTPLIEVLDNNPSQAFQESRQAGNVIGFGLPLVLEGGGAGKPPASSPELVPVGPGVRFPVEMRAPETGPLETRVENNQGPLQSRNEDPNGNTVEGAGETPQGNNNRGTFASRSSATQGSIDETSGSFLPSEKPTAELLKSEGYDVKALPVSNVEGARSPDSLVTDLRTGEQTRVEFKALDGLNVNGEPSDSNSVRNSVRKSLDRGGQARNIIFNARESGLTQEEALRSFRRVGGIEGGRLDSLRIVGDGFDVSTEYPFKP